MKYQFSCVGLIHCLRRFRGEYTVRYCSLKELLRGYTHAVIEDGKCYIRLSGNDGDLDTPLLGLAK